MLADLRQTKYPVEFGLLLAFCIFLPLVEMPKNLAWLLYVVAWFVNRLRDGELGRRLLQTWDGWDTLFALWIGTGYLVSLFSGIKGTEIGGAHELARYALLGWLVKRAGYGPREMRLVMGSLVLATLAGLPYGYWAWWKLVQIGKSGGLTLHSVGHVNHSAIYIAIVIGVASAWTIASWRGMSKALRAGALLVLAALMGSLVATGSRAAFGVTLILLVVLSGAFWPRTRGPLILSIAAAGAFLVSAVALDVEIVRKQREFAAMDNTLSSRDGIWRMALAGWERHPWFGIGMDNYSRLTHERLREWRAERGKDYPEDRYVQHAHAHSLFINALAERGLVGTAVLAAVLAAWLARLWRRYPSPGDPDIDWQAWGAAASAWFVTVGVGLVNTTLHHEHGLLAALLLGLWLSRTTTRRAS